MAQFTIENLSFRYPGAPEPALKDVSFSVEKGDYILLLGNSGSGKSTLLRHLKSVLTPCGSRTGRVLFEGRPLEDADERRQAAAIGFVMQSPDDQIVTDKVWHELAFGLENLGTDPGTMALRIGEMASFFGIQDWFEREVRELSGGQKQLLNLAAVMAMQPEILILDEPTGQLDPIAAADFLATLRRIHLELGTTILITEHRTEDIFPAADRVLLLEGGRIAADGSPRQVGAAMYAGHSALFDALPAPVRVYCACGGGENAPLTIREGRRWLTETLGEGPVPVPALPERAAPLSDAKALELKDVWFRYERDGRDILRGADLTVPEGCLFALLGGNGTGKSTMLKAVCGLCRPYRGTVRLFGTPMKKIKDPFHRCLALLPQDPAALFAKDTVREELAEMTADPEAAAEAARLCELEGLLDRCPRDLSGGERQRAALAKVLLTRPRLLLMDEPTKGMDAGFKRRFAGLLAGLRKRGMTIVMVSHDIEFCAEHADLAALFFNGQVLAADRPRRFFGANSFYTTAANRMSRRLFREAVTAADVTELVKRNREAER